MTARRSKKNIKQKGGRTYGWGSPKKHRGAGNRGGRGMAGSGKRADQKKQSILQEYGHAYFGKRGFVVPNKKTIKAVNISYLNEKISTLVAIGVAKEDKGAYNINLKEAGFNKLLAKGKTANKFNIEVEYATEKAIATIEKAGGKVKLTAVEKEEPVKEEPVKEEKPAPAEKPPKEEPKEK